MVLLVCMLRNKGIVRAGDVLIRRAMEGEKYGAYLVTAGGLENILVEKAISTA